MEPTTKTIDTSVWSNLSHVELKDYGKRYRIEQRKNPETTFLIDNRKKILECFGIGEDDAKYWEIFSLSRFISSRVISKCVTSLICLLPPPSKIPCSAIKD